MRERKEGEGRKVKEGRKEGKGRKVKEDDGRKVKEGRKASPPVAPQGKAGIEVKKVMYMKESEEKEAKKVKKKKWRN